MASILTGMDPLRALLVDGHGLTMPTAVNLMLLSLLHVPWGTKMLTIYRGTNNKKWAALSVVITLGIAFLEILLTASIARLAGWA